MEQQNTAPGFLNINSDVETMFSCEIADLTGKQTEFRAEIVRLDNKKREDRASLYNMAILVELKSTQ
ncbi:hypothetical protein [Endozoicomonas sp.]|uniref:hypothetical protein n=1 Tax=Endozoicomonas sp. TaxID=1892382 RepID=UPI003AF9DFC9